MVFHYGRISRYSTGPSTALTGFDAGEGSAVCCLSSRKDKLDEHTQRGQIRSARVHTHCSTSWPARRHSYSNRSLSSVLVLSRSQEGARSFLEETNGEQATLLMLGAICYRVLILTTINQRKWRWCCDKMPAFMRNRTRNTSHRLSLEGIESHSPSASTRVIVPIATILQNYKSRYRRGITVH